MNASTTSMSKISWSKDIGVTVSSSTLEVFRIRMDDLTSQCLEVIQILIAGFNNFNANIFSLVCIVSISLRSELNFEKDSGRDERLVVKAVIEGKNSLVPFLWQTSHWYLDVIAHSESIRGSLRDEVYAAHAGNAFSEGSPIDVVLNPWCAANFIHETVGHSLEADNFINYTKSANRDFGSVLSSFPITVTDDPSRDQDRRGHYTHDDEHSLAQKVVLVDQGVLSGTLTDARTAKLLGTESNGHGRKASSSSPVLPRMACTVLENGEDSFDQLISDIEFGLLCIGTWGGGSQGETFIIRPCYGRLIRHGVLTDRIYRRFDLVGNKFLTLRQIDGIANDGRIFYPALGCDKDGQNGLPVSMGAPHVRLRELSLKSY